MTDADVTIRLDEGEVNERIIAKEAKVDFRRVEAASRKMPATLRSPEVKRIYARYFNFMQLHMHVISVFGRAKLRHEVVEKVESAIREQLERANAEVNQAIDSAEALCKLHGVTRLATYDTEPLAIEVRVISPFGRRYLELMTKTDQLMPILETLAIDEVIGVAQLDLQKALAKKSLRQIAGAVRNFVGGLRRRMNGASDPTLSALDAPSGGGDRIELQEASNMPLTARAAVPTSATGLGLKPEKLEPTVTIAQPGQAVPGARVAVE